jgi:hypothetical protein
MPGYDLIGSERDNSLLGEHHMNKMQVLIGVIQTVIDGQITAGLLAPPSRMEYYIILK